MKTTLQDRPLAEIRLDPFKHYESPMAVIRDARLSRDGMLAILDAMEHDAHELAVATEENMAGGESRTLSDVLEAKRALGVSGTP